MGKFVKVASVKDVGPGQAISAEAEGLQIGVFNVDGTYYAIDNTCTHAGGPLSEGFIEGGQVECPWHGARFDIKNGQALSAPAMEGVKTYPVRVNGPDIEVEL